MPLVLCASSTIPGSVKVSIRKIVACPIDVAKSLYHPSPGSRRGLARRQWPSMDTTSAPCIEAAQQPMRIARELRAGTTIRGRNRCEIASVYQTLNLASRLTGRARPCRGSTKNRPHTAP